MSGRSTPKPTPTAKPRVALVKLGQGCLGWAYASTGRRAEALTLLEELQERAREQYTPAWSLAVIYQGLGEMDKAFDLFEKAVDERDPLMLHVHVHPNYDPLRTHPRYSALLRTMNLEP